MNIPDIDPSTAFSSNSALHVVRGALIQDGLLLLSQRDNGVWHIPGGKVDPGQTLEDALTRELTEEVGVGSVMHGDFKTFERRTMTGTPPYGGRQYIGHCALGTWGEGVPCPLDETAAVRLVSPREIGRLDRVRPDTFRVLAVLGLL